MPISVSAAIASRGTSAKSYTSARVHSPAVDATATHITCTMTEIRKELAKLEMEMVALTALRAQRIATAQAMIESANRDFDERAVVLGRQINHIRALLNAEEPTNKVATATRSKVVREFSDPDPEWSQDDIDHFKELRRRGSHSTRNARRIA